ncbi:MAG: AAA family ATPase, partial [Saprospiraceae bacterium]|nr:AAA family ATPase [Saprospiraceae bacterium]
ISVQERRTVAYHEAGHATVSWYLKHADELLKVSIVPRGKSLGAAWYLPEEHSLLTKSQLFDRICMALGGRAAELMIFNEVSSGALDDLEKVTKQAYTMVMYYGLSDKLGNISFYDSSGQQDMSLKRPYSEETAQIIDREVQRMVAEAFDQTSDILRAHRKELTELAELLLKKEVVNQEELIGIFGPRMEKSADKSDEVISLGLT